jgi:plasmid maintenance system antidote protein VapI
MTAKTRERFRELVGGHGGSAAAAHALGCSRSYVDMIISGARRPGMKVARAIEELFGIAMQEWVERPRLALNKMESRDAAPSEVRGPHVAPQ